MSKIALNKNFGHLLADNNFLPGKTKFLNLTVLTRSGSLIKKQFKENEKVVVTDIKNVESAQFGRDGNKIDVREKIINLINVESNIEQFIKINKLFSLFCRSYIKVLCPRCHNKEYCADGAANHNSGLINLLFLQNPSSHFNNIFDGMIKCFIAYLINEDQTLFLDKKTRWLETYSYILANKKDDSVSQIHVETSNILHNYFTKGHVKNAAFMEIEKKMKKSTLIMLKIFYKYLYPCLKYFHNNRKDIFIRHGLEKNTDNYRKNMIFPPNDDKSGWRVHKVTNSENEKVGTKLPAYPIEFDMLPLKGCSSHSSKEIYGKVKGFIARTPFRNSGGKIHIRYDKNDNTMAREHLFAESSINSDKWVFTYRTHCKNEMSIEVKSAVRSIIIAELPLISEEGLTSFCKYLNLTLNKFIMLH